MQSLVTCPERACVHHELESVIMITIIIGVVITIIFTIIIMIIS